MMLNRKYFTASLDACTTPNSILEFLSTIAEDGSFSSFSSFTPAIYDTAWLSMVHRSIDGNIEWLFPRCWDYILSTQQEDGTWPLYAAPVDGILNTLASMLALLT